MRLIFNTQLACLGLTARGYSPGIHVPRLILMLPAPHRAALRSARTGIPLCLLLAWSVGQRGLQVLTHNYLKIFPKRKSRKTADIF